MPGILSCFNLNGKGSPQPGPRDAIAYQARRISREIERKTDEEFLMRMQGFESDDPAILAKRSEYKKRRQEALRREEEAQRKEDEERFQQRIQRL
jgi:hypothetical protein